ncbi:polysaccharide deacetylase family protein [Actinomadura mexicana]|uniref:Polysaccharide deacetylase n=1 Tax=Actinomadura mexicana TaxID=134959 RepID=A0A238XBI9_9ACTN|nr:polysaccharide deacetylase family protein [Actinomadura mexicana]SNR56080.1 hypothetical protein SAMN06265355_104155 [Actinomadura mexicana]
MRNELYSYSPITSRPPLAFPNGARLAFYVGLNIEHFRIDMPFPGVGSIPDPLSYGWRDYGNRVGVWRLMELFDEVGIRPSAIINSDVCTEYPQIIEAGVQRDWAWVAHGQTNSVFQAAMADEEPEVEARFLKEMFAALDDSLPARPRGWLGPGLSETFATAGMLADHGVDYLLDWCCDDQPFPLNVPGMLSVPYSLDVNDFVLFVSTPGLSGPDYERIVLDQFEQLLEDSATTGRVLALPVHTFIAGQPFRAKYLKRVLREITSTPEVWVCTSDDIADHYRAVRDDLAGAAESG